MPIIDGDKQFNLIPIIIMFILGWFIINIYNTKPISEDNSYKSAPKAIHKNKKIMITIYIILLLSIITMIVIDSYLNIINPLGLLPYNKISNLYGISIIFALFICIYLFINTILYNIKKFNLPKTWKR
jgi:hypothetical protein